MRRVLVVLSIAVTLGVAQAAAAGTVRVTRAWIRVLPDDLPAAGYATLENSGGKPVALLGARSAAYRDIMLHRSVTAGGESRMLMVPGITVPAHGRARLAPGGYHLMLMHATRPVTPGEKVRITLRFGDGSTETVSFLAMPANASGPP